MLRQIVVALTFALGTVLMVSTVLANADARFTLQNDSCCAMTAASISPAGQNTFTEILERPLPAGEKTAITFDNAQCVWDITARFDDMTTGTLSGANVCTSNVVSFHD